MPSVVVLRLCISVLLATALCTVSTRSVNAEEVDSSRPTRLRRDALEFERDGASGATTTRGGVDGRALNKMIEVGAVMSRWEEGRDLGSKKKKKKKSHKKRSKDKKAKKNAKDKSSRRKKKKSKSKNKSKRSKDGSGGKKEKRKDARRKRQGSKTKKAARDRAQELMDEENAVFIEAFAAAARGGDMSAPTPRPPRPTPRPPRPTARPPTARPPTARPPTARPPTARPPTAPLPCGLTPQDRRNEITAELSQISDPADFADQGSPQRQALDFIVNEDLLQLCPDDPALAQRYISVVFYYSADGPDWTECSAPDDISDPTEVADANANCNIRGDGSQLAGSDAWLTGVAVCEWGGITCDNGGDVESLFFENNNLAGTLPFELQDLGKLKIFHVEEGRTAGTIPEEYGNIKTLEELDFNFNIISGSIPGSLYGLDRLIELDLNDNELTGTIDAAIGNMPNLQFLQLQNNLIEGEVPVEMGQLDRLVILNIDENRITGAMPQQVCDRRNINGGRLASLTADCLNPEDRFYVQCDTPDCCTMCF